MTHFPFLCLIIIFSPTHCHTFHILFVRLYTILKKIKPLLFTRTTSKYKDSIRGCAGLTEQLYVLLRRHWRRFRPCSPCRIFLVGTMKRLTETHFSFASSSCLPLQLCCPFTFGCHVGCLCRIHKRH